MRRLVAVFAVLVIGCGSDPAPPAPTPVPPATPSTITVNAPRTTFRTGQSQAYTATVTMSNGVTAPVANPTWSSTNAGVATVNSGGLVTAAGHGKAVISVTDQGLTSEIPVQVWQDYQGVWVGNYQVRVCSHSGQFAIISWCSAVPPGTSIPLRLTLAQNNGSVSGVVELGLFIGQITGGVFDDRNFVGSTRGTATTQGVVFTFDVGTFRALADGNSMSGSFVMNITANQLTGNAYWEADFSGVTRILTGLQAPNK